MFQIDAIRTRSISDANGELYGFALREGSTLREPLNRVLLQKIHQPEWRTLTDRYLAH
jgi:hypothetical protein